MIKQMLFKCPTGYELLCKTDSEQEKYYCCCCARPGSQICETDPNWDFGV
jgi:hypothetical protein